MADEPLKTCRVCTEPLPLDCFGFEKKNGKSYRRNKCNQCRAYDLSRRKLANENRVFNQLIRWPAPRVTV